MVIQVTIIAEYDRGEQWKYLRILTQRSLLNTANTVENLSPMLGNSMNMTHDHKFNFQAAFPTSITALLTPSDSSLTWFTRAPRVVTSSIKSSIEPPTPKYTFLAPINAVLFDPVLKSSNAIKVSANAFKAAGE